MNKPKTMTLTFQSCRRTWIWLQSPSPPMCIPLMQTVSHHHFFKNFMLNKVSLSRPGWSHEVYLQESRGSFIFDTEKIINDCFFGQVNHMHDFVRETSLTTEEWMYANAFNFLFGYSFHFCLDLIVGRLLISSPRQGRCALIFAKVCSQL